MSQSTDMLTATVTAPGGITLALAAIAALKLARGDRPGQPSADPATPGVVATGYRYCPHELRTRAAVIHTDGTAVCLDCRTHIPATEVPHA